GLGSLEHIRVKRHVLLQHCLLTTERPEPAWWLPVFRSSVLVMSYHDLYALTGQRDFAFYHSPWGVDGSVFRDLRLVRREAVLTSGYDVGQEAIVEFRKAALDVLGGVYGGVIHLGPQLGDGRVDY